MHYVELFELYTGKVFAQLYARFPKPILITSADLIKGVNAQRISQQDQLDIAHYTLRWLVKANYLAPEGEDQAQDFRGTLSTKGFECLRALPSAIAPTEKEKNRTRLSATNFSMLPVRAQRPSPLIRSKRQSNTC